MKVYELMTLLSKCDAGAEVCYCDLVTLDEVQEHFAQEDNGERFYEMRGNIKEVEQDGNHVFLYV